MHALVAPVLLRMSGLDALEADAEAEPPHRETCQAEEEVGAGKGAPLSVRIAVGKPRPARRHTSSASTGGLEASCRGVFSLAMGQRVAGTGDKFAVRSLWHEENSAGEAAARPCGLCGHPDLYRPSGRLIVAPSTGRASRCKQQSDT
jgi:hypothetical protein